MNSYKLCIPDCGICGGVGYVSRKPGADIHDKDFGKMDRCPNSRVFDREMGISEDEARGLDWDKFYLTPAVKQLKPKIETVLERGYGWLYIHGEPGNGKTIMTKSATIHASCTLKMKARYWRLSSMMNELRASYDIEGGQSLYQQRLKELGEVRFLAVDEIGRDRQTEFSKQTLSELMDNRYQLAVSKAGITLWVSNHAPGDILEPYQRDRVEDGRFEIIEVQGGSARPTMDYNNDDTVWWWQD